MSQITKECEHCQQIVRQEKYHQHINLHTQPHELVPKTRPNNLKKIGLSKVLHLDDSTDQSDIAVRSILPDEVPQPDIGKRDVPPPQHQGLLSKGNQRQRGDREANRDYGDNGEEKVGRGIDNGLQSGGGRGFIRGYGSPANDQLDLQSNVIGVSVQGLQGQKLDIEKEVDLKPKKTIVVKKQIHKYQNTHHVARETVDMGGCGKKVIDHPLAQSRNFMTALVEPVYEIKEIQKPFLPIYDPKSRTTVAFSKKAPTMSNPYNAIETKSINSPIKQRPGYEDNENGNRYNHERDYYDSEDISERSKDNGKGGKINQKDRPYPLHPHECSDCHGFYCSTCKSTIPPTFRPFWDQNQKPEIIQYYKSIQQHAERQIRHKRQSAKCNQHE